MLMPLPTKPLNHNVLIEVQRDHSAVSRADDNESMQYGILRSVSVADFHLTASSALHWGKAVADDIAEEFAKAIGKVVRWEQYAEGGQTFEHDGKTYALIPWWRLISVDQK